MILLKTTMARVVEIKEQLVQLKDCLLRAIDAGDWETHAKILEQIVRKLDEVKALIQISGQV